MPDDVAQLDESLTRLIRRLRHPRVRQRLTRGVPDPLERAAHVVLARIDTHEPVRLSELAEILDVDISTASRQVKALLAAGLVTRSPDPADGRAARLSATPTGRDRLEEMRSARRRALAEVLGDWSPADRAELARLVGRFHDDLVAAAVPVSAAGREHAG